MINGKMISLLVTVLGEEVILHILHELREECLNFTSLIGINGGDDTALEVGEILKDKWKVFKGRF